MKLGYSPMVVIASILYIFLMMFGVHRTLAKIEQVAQAGPADANTPTFSPLPSISPGPLETPSPSVSPSPSPNAPTRSSTGFLGSTTGKVVASTAIGVAIVALWVGLFA